MFGCVCCGVPTHVYTGAVQDNACQQWFGPTSLLHVPEGVLTLHVLTLHVLTHHVHTYIRAYVVHIWTDKLASCLHTPLLFPFFFTHPSPLSSTPTLCPCLCAQEERLSLSVVEPFSFECTIKNMKVSLWCSVTLAGVSGCLV